MIRKQDEPAVDWRAFVVCDPQVLGGKPVLKGTRLSVSLVLERLSAGWTPEELVDEHPSLTSEAIRAVLAYAAETMRDDRFHILPPREGE